MVTPADFFDPYVGGTEEKCRKIFQKALNGVLFIDEAHRLADGGENGPGHIVARELMQVMVSEKEHLCVVAAGYPEKLEAFLAIDPGLRSRFSRIIPFEDFSVSELMAVFTRSSAQMGEQVGPGLAKELFRLFEIWLLEKTEDFANARDVQKLLDRMRECRAERLAAHDISGYSNEDLQTFLWEDIPQEEQNKMGRKFHRPEEILAELDSLIGLGKVKEMVRTLVNRLKVEQKRNAGKMPPPGHYLFTGNPGTGKTTVARKMGEIFRALGILKKGHLTETGRYDLVAGYQGQTAIKTRGVLEKSLDGVLFIDEAYQLVEDERDVFGKEALETLIWARGWKMRCLPKWKK